MAFFKEMCNSLGINFPLIFNNNQNKLVFFLYHTFIQTDFRAEEFMKINLKVPLEVVEQ